MSSKKPLIKSDQFKTVSERSFEETKHLQLSEYNESFANANNYGRT